MQRVSWASAMQACTHTLSLSKELTCMSTWCVRVPWVEPLCGWGQLIMGWSGIFHVSSQHPAPLPSCGSRCRKHLVSREPVIKQNSHYNMVISLLTAAINNTISTNRTWIEYYSNSSNRIKENTCTGVCTSSSRRAGWNRAGYEAHRPSSGSAESRRWVGSSEAWGVEPPPLVGWSPARSRARRTAAGPSRRSPTRTHLLEHTTAESLTIFRGWSRHDCRPQFISNL